MKIALVAPTSLPARRANTIQVMKMAQAMVTLGHQVCMAVPEGRPGRARPTWEELAQLYGLQVEFPLSWLVARPGLKRYDYGWRAVRWGRRLGVDVLYTRLPQAAALSSLSGMTTIYELHDVPVGAAGRFLMRCFLWGRGSRRLVAITHSLVDDLAGSFGGGRVRTCALIAPDGVDLERYQELPAPEEARRCLPEQHRFTHERFTAGYTGHLYPGRGMELVLRLANRLPEINFLLVGGEVEAVEGLRQQVATGQLENVLVAGFIPNQDLPLYQAACNVLLMPYQSRVAASSGGDISRYLSPLKLFEYLASGRAILSSDLPVLREVLTPEMAVLLPPDDEQAWCAALVRLQADPSLRERLGQQARQAASQYDWQARADLILRGLEGNRRHAQA